MDLESVKGFLQDAVLDVPALEAAQLLDLGSKFLERPIASGRHAGRLSADLVWIASLRRFVSQRNLVGYPEANDITHLFSV